jgi:hypothetical protein
MIVVRLKWLDEVTRPDCCLGRQLTGSAPPPPSVTLNATPLPMSLLRRVSQYLSDSISRMALHKGELAPRVIQRWV